MDGIRTWQLPDEPGREVRLVQDERGALYVRMDYTFTDPVSGLRFDGWHLVLLRDADSPSGRYEVVPHPVSWEHLVKHHGMLVDLTYLIKPGSFTP